MGNIRDKKATKRNSVQFGIIIWISSVNVGRFQKQFHIEVNWFCTFFGREFPVGIFSVSMFCTQAW